MALKDVKNAQRKSNQAKSFTYYDALAGKEVTVNRTTNVYVQPEGRYRTIGNNGVQRSQIESIPVYRQQEQNESDAAYKRAVSAASERSAKQAELLRKQRQSTQAFSNNPDQHIQALIDQYNQTMSLVESGKMDYAYGQNQLKKLSDSARNLSAQMTLAGIEAPEAKAKLEAMDANSMTVREYQDLLHNLPNQEETQGPYVEDLYRAKPWMRPEFSGYKTPGMVDLTMTDIATHAMRNSPEYSDEAWQYLLAYEPTAAIQEAQRNIDELNIEMNDPKHAGADYVSRTDAAELVDQKAMWEQRLNQATYATEGVRMGDVAVPGSDNYDPDFEAKSRYVQYGNAMLSSAGRVYEYLNSTDAETKRGIAATQNTLSGTENNINFGKLEYLKDTEKQLFNYYYRRDPEEAMHYLDTMQETLNAREASETFKRYDGKKLKEVYLGGAGSGLSQFATGVKSALDVESDYIPYTTEQILGGMIREDLGRPDGKTTFGQVAYDIVSTTANMLPSVLVGTALGGTAGAITMGISASGNAYQEALNAGYNKGQAKLYSAMIGASEATLESLIGGIAKLSGAGSISQKVLNGLLSKVDNAIGRAAIQLGTNAASEGFEEYLQEIISPVLENAILNAGNDINLVSEEAVYAGILGAISSGPFNFTGGEGSFQHNVLRARAENLVGTMYRDNLTDIVNRAQQIAPTSETLGRVQSQIKRGGVESVGKRDIALLTGEVRKAEAALRKDERDTGNVTTKVTPTERTVAINKNATATTSDGGSVAVRGVAFDNGTFLVRVADENGAETNVSRSTLSLGDDISDLIDLAERYKEAAPAVYAAYDNSMDFDHYADDVDMIMGMAKGSVGVNGQKALSWLKNNDTIRMEPEAIDLLFNAGRQTGINEQPLVRRSTGKVTYAEGIDRKNLNTRQRNQVAFMEDFAKLVGVDVEFFMSKAEDGAYVGENGSYKDNRIRIDLNAGMNYTTDSIAQIAITRTASHELTHWLKDIAPKEYQLLRDFVVEKMIDEGGTTLEDLVKSKQLRAKGGLNFDEAIDEIVADGCELMLGKSEYISEYAKRNQKGYNKIRNWLKKFLEKLRKAFKGVDSAHKESVILMEKYAEELLELWDNALKSGLENPDTAPKPKTKTKTIEAKAKTETKNAQPKAEQVGEKMSVRENFAEDKYFGRQIDRIASLKAGSYITVGVIAENSPIHMVGIPAGKLYFDVTKIKQEMESRNDPVPAYIMKDIPKVLNKPMVITEYTDINGKRSASVYGQLYIGGSPVVVGVIATQTQKGVVVSKVQTVHPKRNFGNDMRDENILYIHENKKETKAWFQSLNAQMPLAGATKFGFIRSLQEDLNVVKHNGENSAEKKSERETAPETDSNGRKLSEGQQQYFADSVIRDADGHLIPMYHGTQHGGFTVFDGGKDYWYFTNDRKYAYTFEGRKDNGHLYPSVKEGIEKGYYNPQRYKVYLNVKNPFITEDVDIIEGALYWDKSLAGKLRNKGYDALMLSDMSQVIVLNANQIKNVSNKKPTADPDIRYSERDPLTTEIVRLEQQIKKLEQKNRDAFLAGQMRTARQAGKEVRNREDRIAKLERDLDETKEKYRTSMGEARIKAKQKQENLEAQIKKLKKDSRDDLKEMREKLADLKKQDAQRLKDYRTNRNESDAVKRYRKHVEKHIKDLQDMLFTNTDKKHIPEALKEPIARFLDSLMPQMYSRSVYEKGEQTKRDVKLLNTWDKLEKVLRGQINAQNGMDAGDFNFDGYLDLPPELMTKFEELKENVGILAANAVIDDPLYQMSSGDLQRLDWILNTIKHSAQQMNSMLSATKQSVLDAARSTIDTVNELGETKLPGKIGGTLGKFLTWDNATPFYVFKRFGEGGKTVFNAIAAGWDKLAFNSKKVIDFSESTYTEKEVKAWTKETHDFELDSGQSVRMTEAQMMSLYALSKQEHAMGHLLGGGIRVANIEKGKNKIQQSEQRLLTLDDIEMITGALSAHQRDVADKIQKFMTEQGSAWGNEVSMKRFGYRAFTEEVYFPIMSDPANMAINDKEAHDSSLFRLLNISATKSRTPGANNTIVIDDIFNVYSSHMSDMAKYNALALPVLDAFKWINYKETEKGNDGKQIVTTTVQKSLRRAFGDQAQQYIIAFLKDLNAAQTGGRRDSGVFNVLSSNAKVASVAANVRVAVLQPTAYIKAANLLDPKWLAAGVAMTPKQHKSAVEEMLKYSGIALWKDLGFYDTNIGRSLTEKIKHTETLKDKAVEKSMWLAEKADQMTWGALWQACKREVLATQHLHDEALLKATAERFREVIYATQVVDSTLTRSHIMRDKDGAVKMATSFMSEPTIAYNMMMEQYTNFVATLRKTGSKGQAWQENWKGMARAAGAFSVTALATALVEALTDLAREDEEKYAIWEEAFWKKYGKNVGTNLLSNLNLASTIPVLRDIMSGIEGFALNRQDVEWVTTLKDAVEAFVEFIRLSTGKQESPTKATYYGNITGFGVSYKILKGVSMMSGLPINALVREFQALWNNSVGFFREDLLLKTYDAGDESDTKSAYSEGYITADEAASRLVATGKTEDEAYWDVQKLDGIGKTDKLAQAIISGTGFDAAYEELNSHGYQRKDIDGMVSTLVKTWLQGKPSASGKAYKGHRVDEKAAVDLLVKYANEDREDAEKKVLKWSMYVDTGHDYSEIEDMLLSGEISEDAAIDLMMSYGSKDEIEAEMTAQAYLWRNDNQAYSDLSEQKIDRFIRYCEPAGIDIDDFYEASLAAADMKKAEVVDMILDLDLTAKQKKAMWNAIKQTNWKNSDTPWE